MLLKIIYKYNIQIYATGDLISRIRQADKIETADANASQGCLSIKKEHEVPTHEYGLGVRL